MSLNKIAEITLEIFATVVLIVGVALTAWNIYPMNVFISILGNAAWFALGVVWKKWSLIFIQVVITAIYIAGLINVKGA